jgi:hypothetical protein
MLERDGEITCTEHVRSEGVLPEVKEERNILHAMKRRRTNWIGHMWRKMCCRRKDGRVEMTEDEKEVVSRYCIILRKREYTVH